MTVYVPRIDETSVLAEFSEKNPFKNYLNGNNALVHSHFSKNQDASHFPI